MKRRDFIDAGLKSAIAFTIVPRRVLGGNGFIAPSDKIQVGFIGVGKTTYLFWKLSLNVVRMTSIRTNLLIFG